ncbi:MAG: hypothetical protein EBX19_08185, partial [Actinobacteria bacterium]|nr:hypothetical protein [Actinomycetota bacterium]
FGPGVGEGFGIWRPVSPEGGEDTGLVLPAGAGEEGGDILLAVGAGEAVAVRKRDSVDAQADAGGLGDVFKELHLAGLAVVADAVDVVAHSVFPEHPVFLDAGLEAVHEDVVAALGGVDELKALVGIAAVGIEGGEVMGDGAGVPVVPVGDPGEGLLGAEVDRMGAAAEFLRGEVDVFSKLLPDSLINGVFHLDTVLRLGGPGGAGEVTGEAGPGQAGKPGESIVEKPATGDF